MLAAVDTAIIEIAGGGIIREEEVDFPGHVCSSQSEGWRGELFRVVTEVRPKRNERRRRRRISAFQMDPLRRETRDHLAAWTNCSYNRLEVA